jgi:hypothetical protein
MGLFRAQVMPTMSAAGNLGETRMAAVVPLPHGTDIDQNQAPVTTRFSSIRHVLEPTIGVGPLKQRGRVSIERLLALRDYTKRTSTTRAIVVCLLTPVPALVLTIMIESLPLAPPSLGWHEQGVFWIRLLLSGMAMALLSSMGFKQLAGRALEVSPGQLLAISLITTTLYTGFFVGLAALWTFPVPFLFVIGGIPFVLSEIIAVFSVVNVRAVVIKLEGLQKRMEGINFVSSAVSTFYWIYPLYNVAFEYVGPKYQVALVLVLPIVKAQWKKKLCTKLAEAEDLIPTIMMFTVELFNSLYLTACMQLSRSPQVTAAIVLLDVVLGIVRVRRVHTRTAAVLATVKAEKSKNGSGEWDLLKWFMDRVLVDPAARLNEGLLATARVRGNGVEHSLAESSAAILHTLETSRESQVQLLQRDGFYSDATAFDDTALNQTLEFLFHCEFMVLTEYIECAIPLLYAVYLPILRSLPNATFYGHVRALSTDDLRYAELNILVYWLFQLCSLVIVMLWLRRRFAVSVLHVLAFVLDEQVFYVQSNMVLQILFALQFTIAHLGMKPTSSRRIW